MDLWFDGSGAGTRGSDIDLMVVGGIQPIDLLPALRELEDRFRREVNVTLFSPEEFQ